MNDTPSFRSLSFILSIFLSLSIYFLFFSSPFQQRAVAFPESHLDTSLLTPGSPSAVRAFPGPSRALPEPLDNLYLQQTYDEKNKHAKGLLITIHFVSGAGHRSEPSPRWGEGSRVPIFRVTFASSGSTRLIIFVYDRTFSSKYSDK